jgi:hypothetical protein
LVNQNKKKSIFAFNNDRHMTIPRGIDLAKHILPEEIFTCFTLVDIKEDGNTLHFYLEELNVLPEAYLGEDMESKGFHRECEIKDFPLRDKALYLHVRRRRWLNRSTGEAVSRDWNLGAGGTHYTQSFASFLKGFIGYLPHSGPLA